MCFLLGTCWPIRTAEVSLIRLSNLANLAGFSLLKECTSTLNVHCGIWHVDMHCGIWHVDIRCGIWHVNMHCGIWHVDIHCGI